MVTDRKWLSDHLITYSLSYPKSRDAIASKNSEKSSFGHTFHLRPCCVLIRLFLNSLAKKFEKSSKEKIKNVKER